MADETYEYTSGDPLLDIGSDDPDPGKGVNKTLGGRLILRDVNATILNLIRPGKQQGQIYSILGPSGVGKTTLFRLIAGFDQPDSGRILIGQHQVPTHEGRVGVVSQKSAVFRHMTVLQNLIVAGIQGGRTKQDARLEAIRYLELFDVLKVKDSYPRDISGGQKQRVAIAQQVLVGHELVCMDEPFAGLDVRNTEKATRLLSDLTSINEYLTILVVTHDIPAAISVADHLWLLGLERDENTGAIIEGARVITEYNLIDDGLAWRPDIRSTDQFQQSVATVTKEFLTLC